MHDGKRPKMSRGAHRLSNEKGCPCRCCRFCASCWRCRSCGSRWRCRSCGSRWRCRSCGSCWRCRRCYPAGGAGVASVEEACGAGRALPDQEVRLRFQRQVGDQRHLLRRVQGFRGFRGFRRFRGKPSGEVSRCGRILTLHHRETGFSGEFSGSAGMHTPGFPVQDLIERPPTAGSRGAGAIRSVFCLPPKRHRT